MAIIVNLDVMMAKRKISAQDLAAKIGITQANLSILKNNKGKAIRFIIGVVEFHFILWKKLRNFSYIVYYSTFNLFDLRI